MSTHNTDNSDSERSRMHDETEPSYHDDNLAQVILEATDFLVVVLDHRGHIVRFNPACERATGYAVSEVVGKLVWDVLIPPEEVANVQSVFYALAFDQMPNRYENHWMTKDGQQRLLAWSNTLLRDETGQVRHIVGTAQDITERKQIEAQLQEREERLRFILEGSRDGAWDANLVTGEAYYSPRYAELLDHEPHELAPTVETWLNSIHPDDAPEVNQLFQDYLAGKTQEYVCEHRLRHKSGTWIWVLARGKVTARTDERQPARMAGTISDITERKEQEEQLRIFKALADNSPDAIGIAAPDGIITYANPAFRSMFGYGDETIGMIHVSLFTEEDQRERIPALLESVLTTGSWTGFVTAQRKDGSTLSVQISPFAIRDSNGNVQALPAIMRDMTDIRQAEEQLRLFKALVENAADGIGVATLDGLLTYANPAYQRMARYSDTMVGTNLGELYNEPPEKLGQLVQHVTEEGSWQGELSYRRKDGTTFPGLLSAFAVRTEQGKVQAVAGIIRDNTEQREAEAERAALQQQVIDAQREALRELSTPLLPLDKHVLAMPSSAR